LTNQWPKKTKNAEKSNSPRHSTGHGGVRINQRCRIAMGIVLGWGMMGRKFMVPLGILVDGTSTLLKLRDDPSS
jgi:hypothetical protein